MKDQLMAQYLNQQQQYDGKCLTHEQEDYDEDDVGDDDDEEDDVPIPSNQDLEDFKNKVRIWLDYDSTVSKLKTALRERKKAQQVLTEQIGAFMSKYNIEDLNTKHGKLRCKILEVKAPLTQKVIKERLVENLSEHKGGEKGPSEVINDIFKREGTIQKIVLKKLKRGGMTIN